MLIAYAGWRRWVLGSWKIPTEHADAMPPAVRAFVDELGGDIPVLACHQHLLADVGGDLLERPHARLRELFRRFKVRPGLRTVVRDLGRKLGEDVDRGRDAVAAWKDQTEADHGLPDGNDALAVVRALAQWVLDYAAEGDDVGLPFDRPYLDLYDRCTEARRAVDAFLRRPPEDRRVHRALRRVRGVLDPIVAEVSFSQVAHTAALAGQPVRRASGRTTPGSQDHSPKPSNPSASRDGPARAGPSAAARHPQGRRDPGRRAAPAPPHARAGQGPAPSH